MGGVAECDGLLYVSEEEEGKHRISVFRAEDGSFVRHVGERGDGAAQFNTPRLLHINQHMLYVTEQANNRICVFQL